MRIGDKTYSRAEVLERVGRIEQLGGTRHYTLSDGRANGVRAVDFDTGGGLRFTVLPDRGLDISLASYKGTNLVHLASPGEVGPAFYEPEGMGWLRTFFAGLLTTCGLTYLGSPCSDEGEDLGLHGRHSTAPAERVCDLSGWDGDEYVLELRGVVEETALFQDKIRLTRTIRSSLGARSLLIHDVAENVGYKASPLTVLYHVNAGFPLLDGGSELHLSARESSPSSEKSESGMGSMRIFTMPIAGFEEENFHHIMAAGPDGKAIAGLVSRELMGGLGLYLELSASTLPFMNEWKMMGQGDYVLGMEPCNVPCQSRAVLRESGMLPMLEPGESREMTVEIGVLEGPEEIEAFAGRVERIVGASA